MGEHADELELELARTGEGDDDVRRHVESCASCRTRLDTLRAAVRTGVRPLEPLEIPADLDDAMVRRAREQGTAVRRRLHERRRPSAIRRLIPWAAAAGLAAAALAWLAIREGSAVGGGRSAVGAGPLAPTDGQPAAVVGRDRPVHPGGPTADRRPACPEPACRERSRAVEGPTAVPRSADDINADGRIDVLDAYLVALAADRGDDTAALDRNRDGLVDRRDAERIAMAAVALHRGPDVETTDGHR
ncbi:MAG: hypothetical protein HY907_14610 [Deltaproteobacteria bacterium]|nr:hypothetical protein [Deltaproteobacteria bacterium]